MGWPSAVTRYRTEWGGRVTTLQRQGTARAGSASARDHALITLLAMNGLQIAEALAADIDALDMDRGHRTLRIVREGGKHVTIPLAPRTGART
jgi:integrase